MQLIADWLKKLGMSEYTDRFVQRQMVVIVRDPARRACSIPSRNA
jgi:hypothetical protein